MGDLEGGNLGEDFEDVLAGGAGGHDAVGTVVRHARAVRRDNDEPDGVGVSRICWFARGKSMMKMANPADDAFQSPLPREISCGEQRERR